MQHSLSLSLSHRSLAQTINSERFIHLDTQNYMTPDDSISLICSLSGQISNSLKLSCCLNLSHSILFLFLTSFPKTDKMSTISLVRLYINLQLLRLQRLSVNFLKIFPFNNKFYNTYQLFFAYCYNN